MNVCGRSLANDTPATGNNKNSLQLYSTTTAYNLDIAYVEPSLTKANVYLMCSIIAGKKQTNIIWLLLNLKYDVMCVKKG